MSISVKAACFLGNFRALHPCCMQFVGQIAAQREE